MQYGTSALASTEPVGLPVLRMNNLQANGWDLSDLKYLDLSVKEVARYRLNAGDIVFNRTNGSRDLVGKCEVFREAGDWLFASYLIRVGIDHERALPEFIVAFLSSQSGRAQIERLSRQIMMFNINAKEIRSIKIPLPGKDAQAAMVKDLQASRDARDAKLAQADALLSGIDDLVLAELGLPKLTADGRLVYAVRLDGINARLNAEYYHPERVLAVRAIEKAKGRMKAARLAEIADFKRDAVKVSENARYLGLASIESNTGELTGQDETASGLAFVFQKNDVLFSRLRPYLNKVRRAEEPGICSTEFHVIRIKEGLPCAVLPQYLACVLRSSPILAQTRHMMTGNTHPRLANADVVDLVVPLPDKPAQKRLADDVARRKEQVRRVRVEAVTLWAKALEDFERRLLAKGTKGGSKA